MGIALTIIAIALVLLFILGRPGGAGKASADVVNAGVKTVAAVPVVAAKAVAGGTKGVQVAGKGVNKAAAVTHQGVKAGSKITKVTAQHSVEAGKKGLASFVETYKAERAKQNDTVKVRRHRTRSGNHSEVIDVAS